MALVNFITRDGTVIIRHTPEAAAILSHAEQREYNGHNLLVVPHGLQESKVLRNLGYPVMSPVALQEKFSGVFQPYEHQKDTASFLTLHNKCLCLNDMGTGKTAASLYAIDYLIKVGEVKSVLIAAPLSTLESVWGDEVFKVTPHITCTVVTGGREKKDKLLQSGATIHVVNHDALKFMEAEIATLNPDLIIIDEASMFRTASASRYKSLDRLGRKAKRLWLFTATPIPKAPTDAWALARLVNPKTPPYFKAFQRMVMDQISTYKWVPKADANKTAFEFLTPAIRYKKSDCLDLPPVTYVDIKVPMTAKQTEVYKKIQSSMLMRNDDGTTITAVNAAVKMLKLLQVSAGGVYDDDHTFQDVGTEQRIDVVADLVERTNNKVIVFVPFKMLMHTLVGALVDKHGLTVSMVNGDVSAGKRRDIFHDFMQPNGAKVLVAHPATTSHGLTLTAADTVIWFAPTVSADHYIQANNRADRPGQKNNVTIYSLYATALEKQWYSAVHDKRVKQDDLLAMYSEALKEVISI
jgi:SNF2 family DNA or RNA helicase